MNIIKEILSDAINYVMPPRCHLCDTLLADGDRYLCPSCLARIPRTLYHRRPDNQMANRFAGIVPFERATGHFFYSRSDDMSRLMQDLKYRRFRGLGRFLGSVAGRELFPSGWLSDIDVIMPVPMHRLKQARRGYNPAMEIARGIADASGISISEDLKAVRRHRTQTSLTLAERRRNIDGIFQLGHGAGYAGKHILIVDDVCTTGTTLTGAAETVLAASPAARISLFSLGVTF